MTAEQDGDEDQSPEAENGTGDDASASQDGNGVDFPIVGVGASAGGLNAYHRFLAALPADPGFALVFAQHLDPGHASMMADLLDRHSRLPMREVEDRVKVEPNHVYMIPSNKFLSLSDGMLHLEETRRERGQRMPIDHFFRSLAEAQQERAICVILSGTGTDGTQGLREVKAHGGIVIVQDPAEAEYDGMPRSALATGDVDLVMSIADIPQGILDFAKQPYLAADVTPGLSQSDPESFSAILNLLQAQTDYDFRCYKKGTLERRIQRRMGLRRAEDAGQYLRLLRRDRDELTSLFKDLLIGVTWFFRDPEVWTALQSNVIAPMVAERGYDEQIRVWVPGCASGEEAYTIAILFFEEFERQKRSPALQIYATDLDEDAIEVARAGRYPDSIAAEVSKERLERFFTAEGQSYVVAKRLRETAVFAIQNVISDPPFSRIDLVSCRNLLIYLDNSIQRRVRQIFHFALNEGGYLLLGTSESSDKASHLFEKVAAVERTFRKIGRSKDVAAVLPRGRPQQRQNPPDSPRRLGSLHDVALADTAKNILLEAFAPPSVICDRRRQIRYLHGNLRDYMDLPKGEPNIELFSLTAEGLRAKLRVVFNRAVQKAEPAETVVQNFAREGKEASVRIRVAPTPAMSEAEPMYLVSFADVPLERPADAKPVEQGDQGGKALSQLEYELQTVREDYQSAIEELETANEELKASNEEVMSINEELQSTNEELETSREELQSLNEELSTLNNQLQEKLKELEASNDDLSNLIISTDIATIFLDTDFCIRRFTPASRKLLNVIEGDVGRPISDLAPKVHDPRLIDDCRAVLGDLQPREAEVEDNSGGSQLRRVRPYRTSDNRIDGVIITYAAVTGMRAVIDDLHRRNRQQTAVAELGQKAVANAPLDELFGMAVVAAAEQLGCAHAKVLEYLPGSRSLLLRRAVGFEGVRPGETHVSAGNESQAGFTLRQGSPVIVRDLANEKRFSGPAILTDAGIVSGISVIIGSEDDPWGVLGVHSTESRDFTVDDVSFVRSLANLLSASLHSKRFQDERDALAERMQTVLDAAAVGTWVWNPETDTAVWDERLRRLAGLDEDVEPTGANFFRAVHPDDLPGLRAALDDVNERGEPLNREYRVIGPDGTVRWLVSIGKRAPSDSGSHILGVTFDVTERHRQAAALAEAERRREIAVEAARLGTFEHGEDSDEIICDARFREMFGFPEAGPVTMADFRARVHPDDWPPYESAVGEMQETGQSFKQEYRILPDGEERWIRSQGYAFENEGRITIIGLTEDITPRRREQERQQLLMAELDHRVKNILANVNAIARQTAHSRPNPESFITALEGRLAALSDAHSLLSVSRWQGVDLRMLLNAELAPFSSGLAERIALEGEAFVLSPRAAQALCLFIHELITNAAKHGALSAPEGELTIRWGVREEDRLFFFDWAESGGPPVSTPTQRGFGLSVIEEMTSADLNAEVQLGFEKSGFTCSMRVDRSEVAASSGDGGVFETLPIRRQTGSREDIASVDPMRILVAEDVWTVGLHLKTLLQNDGHDVLGPAARLEEGLALAQIDGIDAAILDVRLGEELVFPLADRLAERGVPFSFSTGYADSDIIPDRLEDRPVLSKPYTAQGVMRLLARLAKEA